MSKVAVHIHIFYPNMWPKIKKYLSNLNGIDSDIYVTLTEKNDCLEDEIQASFPNVTICFVPNKGYDIGPFFYFLKKIDLNKYDYILKLHSKNENRYCITKVNGLHLTRAMWNNLLYKSLLGSSKIIKQNLKAMDTDPGIGMIGSRYLITNSPRYYKEHEKTIKQILSKLNLPNTPISFVAGTMFLIRSKILKPLLDAGYDINSFSASDPSIHEGTLAHTMERVFGVLTTAQKYRICGFDNYKFIKLNSIFHKILRFIFQKKISQNNCLTIKILRIPIYHKKVS